MGDPGRQSVEEKSICAVYNKAGDTDESQYTRSLHLVPLAALCDGSEAGALTFWRERLVAKRERTKTVVARL